MVTPDMIIAAGHRGVHNFSYGTLATYFLPADPSRVTLENGVLAAKKGSYHKAWVFDGHDDLDVNAVSCLQTRGPVYSQSRLPLTKESKFNELVYNLDAVFDPASYRNAKKRAQRITYPSRWMENRGFTIAPTVDEDKALILHEEWREWKLSNPKTFQMMFPSRRYFTCVQIALARPDLYAVFTAIDEDGDLAAVRVLYVEGSYAFDLANFAASWRLASNFSEYFGSMTMAALHARGVKTLNCGASLNKELSMFKKHWPSTYKVSFAYGRVK